MRCEIEVRRQHVGGAEAKTFNDPEKVQRVSANGEQTTRHHHHWAPTCRGVSERERSDESKLSAATAADGTPKLRAASVPTPRDLAARAGRRHTSEKASTKTTSRKSKMLWATSSAGRRRHLMLVALASLCVMLMATPSSAGATTGVGQQQQQQRRRTFKHPGGLLAALHQRGLLSYLTPLRSHVTTDSAASSSTTNRTGLRPRDRATWSVGGGPGESARFANRRSLSNAAAAASHRNQLLLGPTPMKRVRDDDPKMLICYYAKRPATVADSVPLAAFVQPIFSAPIDRETSQVAASAAAAVGPTYSLPSIGHQVATKQATGEDELRLNASPPYPGHANLSHSKWDKQSKLHFTSDAGGQATNFAPHHQEEDNGGAYSSAPQSHQLQLAGAHSADQQMAQFVPVAQMIIGHNSRNNGETHLTLGGSESARDQQATTFQAQPIELLDHPETKMEQLVVRSANGANNNLKQLQNAATGGFSAPPMRQFNGNTNRLDVVPSPISFRTQLLVPSSYARAPRHPPSPAPPQGQATANLQHKRLSSQQLSASSDPHVFSSPLGRSRHHSAQVGNNSLDQTRDFMSPSEPNVNHFVPSSLPIRAISDSALNQESSVRAAGPLADTVRFPSTVTPTVATSVSSPAPTTPISHSSSADPTSSGRPTSTATTGSLTSSSGSSQLEPLMQLSAGRQQHGNPAGVRFTPSPGLSSALVSSPFSSMLDVFGAASQYLMRFKPLSSPPSGVVDTLPSGESVESNGGSLESVTGPEQTAANSTSTSSTASFNPKVQPALTSSSGSFVTSSTPSSTTTSTHAANLFELTPTSSRSLSGFLARLSMASGVNQRRQDICGRTIQTPERRIIGGEGARYGEFPYQVHIKIAKHQCGGALVDKQSIVTAAHCVYHFITRAPVSKLQIVIGAYDIEDEQYQELPPQYFKVNKVKLHPNFRFSASHPDRYDIAILKLDKPVKYTDNVLPVCLPTRDLKLENMIGTVTGFGKTDPSLSNRYGTRLLQKVDVPIIENNECEQWHRTRGIDLKIFPEMMCAGYEDGLKDACVGDSGGPLVVKSPIGPNGAFRWTLAGITSAGFGCAQSRQPGIYHRVSHTVDWILDNLS